MPNARKRKVVEPQIRGQAFTQAVLVATLNELAERGFERLSIPQVAVAAGVNKTSVYRRWPDKSALVREALAIAVNHHGDVPDTGTLRGDLVELAKRVAAFMQSRVGTALIRIMLAQGENLEMRALAVSAYAGASKEAPWLIIQRALKRGELNLQVDPSLMLFTIAGAIMHRVFVEQSSATDTYIAQVVDMVLSGAGAKH
jgi:AcrR family transcriptional regulator